MGNFKEDIARIRAFVFDVDGVMTDGGITVTPEGEFLRTFYAKDGYALSLALKKGYRIAIITGGRGKALQVRFDMIGIEHVYTNCHHKLKALHELCGIWSMEPDEIMYMGDDVPDLEPMTHVGMPVCPADAAMEVIGISRYVSQFNGGAGCVREATGTSSATSRYRSRRDNRSVAREKAMPARIRARPCSERGEPGRKVVPKDDRTKKRRQPHERPDARPAGPPVQWGHERPEPDDPKAPRPERYRSDSG